MSSPRRIVLVSRERGNCDKESVAPRLHQVDGNSGDWIKAEGGEGTPVRGAGKPEKKVFNGRHVHQIRCDEYAEDRSEKIEDRQNDNGPWPGFHDFFSALQASFNSFCGAGGNKMFLPRGAAQYKSQMGAGEACDEI